jgi:hypothetical protein
MIHFLRWSALAFAYFICAIAALWAIGALYFDLPWTALRGVASIILASAFVSALIFLSGYFWCKRTPIQRLWPRCHSGKLAYQVPMMHKHAVIEPDRLIAGPRFIPLVFAAKTTASGLIALRAVAKRIRLR